MLDFIIGWVLYYNYPIQYSLLHHNDAIDFLSQNPFGVKFNEELSVFFVNLFKWSTSYTPDLIPSINIGFLFGFNAGLYMIVNTLFVLYLGHYLYYIVMARIHRLFLSVTYSLFLLFRSKRFNVLKNRTEVAYFEMDQLVLGTIIFVPFILAFPTVILFYGYSVCIVCEILIIQWLYSFITALFTNPFECKEVVGNVEFFSTIPTFGMIKRHLLKCIYTMDIDIVKFSLYNEEEAITFSEFIKGAPIRLKRK